SISTKLLFITLLAFAGKSCLAYDDDKASEKKFDLTVRGFADLSLALTDKYASWLDYGTSKGRYGGDGDRKLQITVPEAQVVLDLRYGPHVNLHTSIKYGDQQANTLDILEAYVKFKSGPLSQPQWSLKLGSFFPPISLENTAIGWTSPYTLSSAAINAWVGEELRINGAELRARFRFDKFDVDILGAGFFANDAAGSLLGYRGWAIHDHELGLFGHAPLPQYQLEIRNPNGAFRGQSHRFQLTHEIDGNVGAYLGTVLKSKTLGKLQFLAYDNNGDPEAFNRTEGQYAWDTRFLALGYQRDFLAKYRVILQSMLGETVMGPKIYFQRASRNISSRIVDAKFFSAMGLVNRRFGDKSLSLRGEYFEMRDNDAIRQVYDNAESGYAFTATGNWRMHKRLKLSLEVQYIDHERPVRRFAFEPEEIGELSSRLNLRAFF
ncbi:MAG: outer membrane beta-barrel protein, partial [Pseudomonadota bacterium]